MSWPGFGYGSLHRLLHHARIEMMAALGTGFPVAPPLLLGEHPLPRPLPIGVWVLPGQGIGHQHTAPASLQVTVMQAANPQQMLLQCWHQTHGQQGNPVLPPLSVAHGDLPPLEVDILDPQPQGLHQPQATAIQEAHN